MAHWAIGFAGSTSFFELNQCLIPWGCLCGMRSSVEGTENLQRSYASVEKCTFCVEVTPAAPGRQSTLYRFCSYAPPSIGWGFRCPRLEQQTWWATPNNIIGIMPIPVWDIYLGALDLYFGACLIFRGIVFCVWVVDLYFEFQDLYLGSWVSMLGLVLLFQSLGFVVSHTNA